MQGQKSLSYDPAVLRRLQLIQCEIVKAIDAVCKEHDITYFLDSGTALGAVRHKGFIPWDDDVDLGMLREDYDRFMAIAPEALGDDYTVGAPGKLDGFAPMFAKVWKRGTKFHTQETIEANLDQGIFVDIFPYDPLHADEKARAQQMSRCRLWQSISYLYHAETVKVPHAGVLGALEDVACTVAHYGARALLSPERIARNFDTAARGVAASSTDRYAAMAYPVGQGFTRDMLMPVGCAEFEGVTFPVPHDVEAYLEVLYGSTWEQLPPPEGRVNHAPVLLDFGEGPVEAAAHCVE